MVDTIDYRPVLRAYPADCQPDEVEFLSSIGGFSGAKLWRLSTPRGLLCLRRWPREHPTTERLEFIQAVLWHVHQEGFTRAPLPLEATSHRGYVSHAEHLWELTPWLPGRSDYRTAPSTARLRGALVALAEFHLAAASFPLPEAVGRSPLVGERHAQLRGLLEGEGGKLRNAVMAAHDPFASPARRILDLFALAATRVQSLLEQLMTVEVPLSPCLRDIWHENVLFQEDKVTGLIDFGSMRAENVAADIARLLGSMAEDDRTSWVAGLTAYERVRRLSDAEARFVIAADASGVLLGGMNWLRWLYVDGRVFEQPERVRQRLEYFCRRLTRLVENS